VLLLGGQADAPFAAALHNAAFEAAGSKARFEVRRVAPSRLADTVAAMRRDAELVGASVAAPHSTAIAPLLDGLGPEASAVGVVTTVSYRAGALIGWNTDSPAFLRALEVAEVDARGADVLILGAGGAARSVAGALRGQANRIWLAGRDLARARSLCQDLELAAGGPISMGSIGLVLRKAAIVINATPVGGDGHTLIVPVDRLRPSQFVFDLLYNPPLTPLVRGARQRGARAINGLTMLLFQGLAAFEIWTGTPAPEAAMRAALERTAVLGLAA
jgi:shikimate dehydrogenase